VEVALMVRRVVSLAVGLVAAGTVLLFARPGAVVWYGPLILAGGVAVLATLMALSLSRRASLLSHRWANTSRVFAQAEADHAAALAARPDPRNTVQVNL
jgi:hypothetical protein